MNISKSVENFSNYFYENVANKSESDFACSAMSAHLILSMAAYGAEEKTAEKIQQDLKIPTEYSETLQEQSLQEYEGDELDSTFNLYDAINNKTAGMLNRLFRVVNNVYLKVNTEEPLEDEDYYYDAGKTKENKKETNHQS